MSKLNLTGLKFLIKFNKINLNPTIANSGADVLLNFTQLSQVTFTIQGTSIDATLYLPYTTVYLGNSYITPILNIYTPYNEVYWDFGDGSTLTNDINPIHHYTQPGTYTLKAVVNEGFCSRIFESQITILQYNINDTDNTITNTTRPRPTSNYYSIDGKLVKRL